jgi:hypothetical protein
MRKIKKHLKRLTLPVEYRKKSEMLNGAILAFLVSIFMFIIAIGFYTYGFFRAAHVLFVGGLIYEVLFIYYLFHLTKRSISKIRRANFQRMASILGKLVFGLVFLTLFILILISQPVEKEVNKLSLVLALVAVLIPVFFWKKSFKSLRKFNKKWLILPILLLFVTPIVVAENDSIMDTIQTVKKGASLVEKTYDSVIKIGTFFASINFKLASLLNISEGTSSVVTIVVILAIIFVLLQFIKFITKWAIVLLVVWIVLQLLGVV